MTVVASKFERKHHDLYETEKWATEALLRHFPVRGMTVWEPAAGNHLIADVLLEAGAETVLTTDIKTYDRHHFQESDFFSESLFPPSAMDMLITNPPYGKGNRDAVRFAELALDRCFDTVALLLTAKFDFGKTRHHLFRDEPRFTAKINLVDRIQWFPGATTGTEDHAWYVWTSARPATYPTIRYEGKLS
jgi:predicted RNA methylase